MRELTIGECPQCWSYFIEPPVYDAKNSPKKCSACEKICYPLEPLVRHTFAEGSRIDVHGRVWGPDGDMIYERKRCNPEKPDGELARMRKWIRGYDEGFLSEGEIGAHFFRAHVEEIIKAAKTDFGLVVFSSYCGAEPPPPIIERVEIEVGVAHIIVRPVKV